MDFDQIWSSELPWRSTWRLWVMIVFTCSMAQPDLPCSLSTGMSRESFTASELLPTGSVVGVLSIIGDASENGTIQLTLSQDDAAVEIIPGSKNVSLRKLLDREGIDGPSEVNLVVYCRKKDSAESVFSIPLRVFVSDANDNSPQFVDFPSSINISEITPVGTVVTSRPIRAVDKDQTGPFSTVQYSVEESSYSEHFTFANPLKGILSLQKPLDFEKVQQFNITIKAQDLGDPPTSNTVVIPVHVLDADDLNPKFEEDGYLCVIADEAPVGTVLDVKPRSIKAHDMDKTIRAPLRYSFKSAQIDGKKYFVINESTGIISIHQVISEDVVFPLTLVIQASQIDNKERSALTTLDIKKNSSLGLRFTRSNYQVNIPENLPINQTVIILTTNKQNNKNLEFEIVNASSENFGITKKGELMLVESLDYDVVKLINVRVNVTDGKLFDYTWIHINVIDVNKHSPKFKSHLYNFVVSDTELRAGSVLGQVQVEDKDSTDYVTLKLLGSMANSFSIDNEGLIRVVNSSVLNSSLTHLMVIATDSGFPPRQSSVPVIVSVADRLALSSMFNAESSYMLMIIFGAVLGILIIVILILALYIAKQRSHSSLTTYVSSRSGLLHEKLLRGSSPLSTGRSSRRAVGMENPIFRQEIVATPPASCRSDHSQANRSIASTALVKNESRLPSLISNLNPKENDENDENDASNENGEKYSPSTSSVRQNSNSAKSIHRRVKKLSWEDEQRNKKTELDPCVSVTPITNHENSACYF